MGVGSGFLTRAESREPASYYLKDHKTLRVLHEGRLLRLASSVLSVLPLRRSCTAAEAEDCLHMAETLPGFQWRS